MASMFCLPASICKKKSKAEKDLQDFKDGQERMIKELDLVTIVDAVRKVNVLTELLLNEKQKILVDNQPLNHISGQIYSYPNYPKDYLKISQIKNLGKELEKLSGGNKLNMKDPTTKKLIDLILGSEENLESLDDPPSIPKLDSL